MTDTDRFEAFVREFQDMVFATAVRLLGGAVEAEDVAQTVFLRAFERFDEIGASPRAAGWLKKVTTNLCLNYLSRYRARWQFFSELDSRESGEAAPGRGGHAGTFEATLSMPPVAGANVEALDRHERLERALHRLPDHQRVPLVLFHFEDMSYDAIAAALGVSLGKVKTDIHRGREALKKELTIVDGSR
jgi:RNA polymerase sigma-70 factor (ECF subfamily)